MIILYQLRGKPGDAQAESQIGQDPDASTFLTSRPGGSLIYVTSMRLYQPRDPGGGLPSGAWKLEAYSSDNPESYYDVLSHSGAAEIVTEPDAARGRTSRELLKFPGAPLGTCAVGRSDVTIRLTLGAAPVAAWTATLEINLITYPNHLSPDHHAQ